jgi:glycosyltransferase involved in cell wall biosynthesis
LFHRVGKPLGKDLLGMPPLDRVGRWWARRIAARGGRVIVNGGNCPWPDVNWVHYVHAAWGSGWKRRLFMRDERRALQVARLIIANSEQTRRDLVEKAGVDPQRVRTVFYGVDAEQFTPPTDADRLAARRRLGWAPTGTTLAFIGALGDRRKGFDTLFDAWRQLAGRRGWEARLAVMGVGAELEAWKSRAQAAGLGSIEFMGYRSDVPQVLRGCDALVAPTRYEAYGLGVHEALCCGMPALVSARAGVAEQYSPELRDLLIADPDDAAALAGQLWKWHERRMNYRTAALRLSESLRRRTWDQMAREIVEAAEESEGADGPMTGIRKRPERPNDLATERPAAEMIGSSSCHSAALCLCPASPREQ